MIHFRLRDPRLLPLVAGPAVAAISLVEGVSSPDFRNYVSAIAVVAAWLGVGLILQARFPAAGAVVTAFFYPIGTLMGVPGLTGAGLIGLLIACGYAGSAVSSRRSWVTLAAVTATIMVAEVATHGVGWDVIFLPVIFVVALWSGRLVRRERLRSAELLKLTRQLDATREAAERVAVSEERTRIAREVHDSVAHTVSVMTLQTGGVRRQLADVLVDRPQENEVLLGLERLGRQTVEELRSLVGILRNADTGEPSAAVPSLARAADLVADVAATGFEVTLETTGQAMALPRALDLSAYRILQEALTNVLRHAPDSRAEIRIGYAPDAVEITVHDHRHEGPRGSQPGSPGGGGHGLVNMRERAQLFGGTLTTTSRADGFEVHARLPVSRGWS